MKIPAIIQYYKIPKQRRNELNSLINSYDNFYKKHSVSESAVMRNKIGLPFHFGVSLLCLASSVSWLSKGEVLQSALTLFFAKLNYDFIPIINNINKKKASLLAEFLKNRKISDPKELDFAISKYLIKNGSFHYPFLHPKKMEKLVTTGEFVQSFEPPGIIRKMFKFSRPQKPVPNLSK